MNTSIPALLVGGQSYYVIVRSSRAEAATKQRSRCSKEEPRIRAEKPDNYLINYWGNHN
jgi:hypothetical protein